MSGAFSAKVDISTKEAVAGLRAARTEARLFGQGLNELDKIIRANKQNLVLAAQQFTKLVAAQRAAAAGAKDMAQADIAAARAAGIRNVAEAKKAELLARKGNQEAQAARAAAQGALADARVSDMAARREVATERATRATQRAARSQMELHDSLSNTRYLMYDVGATYAVLSAGLLAIPAATGAVSMAYERDFANVLRVNDDLRQSTEAAQEMKDGLKDIATEIPIAFGELTRITQLGAQMDVPNSKLQEFTETTAKFVAVTGITADAGATMFGRMETSFTDDVAKYPDFFERLGSSIAKVGADTVATDPEIAALLNQIGPLGAQAGFSAAEITGLSAALASVRVQPELARGTLTRVFGQLNRDVAEGSPRLNEFGKLMKMNGEEAGKLWQSNPSRFFQSLIKGLNDTHTNGGNLTTTLDKLGIKASRDVSAITKLAVGYSVLDKSMASANEGFADGTALNEMSKPIFDTAVAKLQKLANSWQNLAETLGAGSLGPLSTLIDMAANLAIGLDSLIDKAPWVGTVVASLMGFAAVTAVFLGFKAAQAFVIAGLVGFQQASTRGIGASMSLTGVLKQSAQTMLIAKGATEAQSRALLGQAGAWKALQIAATTSSARLAATATVSNAVEGTTSKAAGGVRGLASGLLGMAGGPIGIAVMGLAALAGGFLNAAIEAEQAGKAIATAMDQSADSGRRAIAEQLTNKKVTLLDGNMLGDLDKNAREIAEKVGIEFEDMVNSVAQGSKAVDAFNKVLAKTAESKGMSLEQFKRENFGDVAFLEGAVKSMGDSAAKGAKDLDAINDVAPKAGAAVLEAGDDFEEGASDIDRMTDALKALNDEVFGTINAEADLQAALQKIGEGLYESKSFGTNTEGGRENLKNFQDTMQKSRDYYVQLMAEGTLTAEQAAQGYADFVQGLIDAIRVQGGDTSGVEALAVASAQKFQAAIGANPARVPMKVETATVMQEALAQRNVIQEWYNANEVKVKAGADTVEADTKLSDLLHSIMEITGLPYGVVLDAVTDPASEKAREVEALLLAITNDTYVAPVDADTTAAISNIQNFVAYARTELSKLHTQMNGGVGWGDGEGSMPPEMKAQYGAINAPTQVRATRRVPVNVDPTPRTNLGQNLGGLADGYNKAAKAAEKAGDAGKKAAKDIADGIDDAVKSAEDYASRLRTALTSAFNQQYGLTKATDDYHSALNAINKKRDEEIKQLDELKQKVIDLNNERNKELITANKAKIEQNISLKYGEADRAADYGQQAKTALDNAAAKQKDITATSAQARELAAGIGALTGYSDAAIANRAALRDLESKMLDMVAAYAATGKSQEQVRAYAQKLTGQFQTDVGQIGFNRAAISGLQGDLDRYITTIARVPLVVPTDVQANTGAATQAMSDFGGLADVATRDRDMNVKVHMTLGEEFQKFLDAKGEYATQADINGDTFRPGRWMGGTVPGMYAGGLVPGQSPANPRSDNMLAKVDGKGLIGIRSREFIQPEPAVDYYGLDFMEAIRTMRLPKFNMGGSPSGARGGGGGYGAVMDLGADTLKVLTDAMRTEVRLELDSREIARATNKGNKQLSAEGHN